MYNTITLESLLINNDNIENTDVIDLESSISEGLIDIYDNINNILELENVINIYNMANSIDNTVAMEGFGEAIVNFAKMVWEGIKKALKFILEIFAKIRGLSVLRCNPEIYNIIKESFNKLSSMKLVDVYTKQNQEYHNLHNKLMKINLSGLDNPDTSAINALTNDYDKFAEENKKTIADCTAFVELLKSNYDEVLKLSEDKNVKVININEFNAMSRIINNDMTQINSSTSVHSAFSDATAKLASRNKAASAIFASTKMIEKQIIGLGHSMLIAYSEIVKLMNTTMKHILKNSTNVKEDK